MRRLLGILIGHISYIPVFASDGKGGLEKAIAEKPKLIVMDFMMPRKLIGCSSFLLLVLFRLRLYRLLVTAWAVVTANAGVGFTYTF